MLAIAGGALLLVGGARRRRRSSKGALQVGKSLQQVARARSYPYRARARVDAIQRATGRKLPLRPGAFRREGMYPDLEAHELAITGEQS